MLWESKNGAFDEAAHARADEAARAESAQAAILTRSVAPSAAFPSPDSPGVATIISDASGDIAGGDAGCGGFVLHPLAPGLAFTMSESLNSHSN